MTYFYSHLIEIESIVSELDKMELTEEERIHLAKLVDSSLHHTILDAILSELSYNEKRVFLKHVTEEDHVKIWSFLNEKIDGVEDKIKNAADGLKQELHKDLRSASKGQNR